MLAVCGAHGGGLWDVATDPEMVRGLEGSFWSTAFVKNGAMLANGKSLGDIALLDVSGVRPARSFSGHARAVTCMAAHPDGTFASGSDDATIKLWDSTQVLLRTLEGHTGSVHALSFLADGRLLASVEQSGIVRVWDPESGESLAMLPGQATGDWPSSIASHPAIRTLACAVRRGGELVTEILELDPDVLLGRPRARSVTYTSAKVVLVGESGVGKTGLGWRLTHPEFVEHASTHGQQFWLLDDLGVTRADGAQCEAVLWDLAGQPDYRLIHALFLDDADLALVLIDPTRDDDPLRGVDYWLRQLGVGPTSTPDGEGRTAPQAILVGARCDRGAARMTDDEMQRFCEQRGLRAFVETSALTGDGLDRLLAEMRDAIDWAARPTTVTSATFKVIKDYVLGLKEGVGDGRVILRPAELREHLERDRAATTFTDDEMLSAVGHLANHGYVTRLSTSDGEALILLAPELLNNVAASIVLEARRNPKGLGSLEEQRVLSGEYRFPELDDLSVDEREVLLDSAVVRFLDRNICFRQTDPLTSRVYLVFPELINLRKPALGDEPPVRDGVSYSAAGAVENLYASLVVLLGYTSTFTRTNQWRDHARYVVGADMVCGFRVEAEREGELDFVLYFGETVGASFRTLFQSLFESFLARRRLTVRRFEPVICANGHQINRAVVREQVQKGKTTTFCADCGKPVSLPTVDTPIVLTAQEAQELHEERGEVAQRSRFEQVLFRLSTYVAQEDLVAPSCFVSYAWGDAAQERWVEQLAEDLVKSGLVVILDRWDNARVGASVPRFLERIATSDRVVVIGTTRYRHKYDNDEPMGGYVAAAEGDLIGERMTGSEQDKETVLPVLLDGTKQTSLPALLAPRVHADFRDPARYFAEALRLVLSLYAIPARSPIALELDRLMREAAP